MMLPSRANELQEIILRLGSRSPARADAARARLSIIGARAVESLIEALEGGSTKIRARVMPLLALIQDPRGREPLIAMLLDRNARLREIAARSLARFPSADVLAALNRTLQREPKTEVRVAAVQSLLEQYAAGQEQAIGPVVEALLDPLEDARVREAALGLLPLLRSRQRESLLQRLRQDPQTGLRRKVERLAAEMESSSRAEASSIESWIAQLGAEDYAVWNDALQRLGGGGARVVAPLVEAMQSRSHDPEYCTRAGMALRALGPRRGRVLADILDEVEEPLPLQVLVDVIGAWGEKSLIYRLKELIERVAAQSAETAQPSNFDPLPRVRAKAHLELARIGSRVAIEDLRGLLGDSDARVDLEALAAIELIGKRDEIGILLRAYAREDPFMRERIAGSVRTIMRRERLRRNNRTFQRMTAAQRRALQAILPPVPARRRRPGHRSVEVG